MNSLLLTSLTRSTVCSGGYDNALLHFDARTKSLLSHLDLGFSFLSFGSHSHPIVAPPADGEESSISLSPPFILSLSISPSDTIAASTASGHIWIGRGGSKEKSQGKRKSRKWNGLKSTEGQWIRVGNGPIVAVFASILLFNCHPSPLTARAGRSITPTIQMSLHYLFEGSYPVGIYPQRAHNRCGGWNQRESSKLPLLSSAKEEYWRVV